MRNKRIAIEAVTLLERAATEDGLRVQEWLRHELSALRARWEARGVHWLRPPSDTFDPDEWLNANDMAARADVKPETVRRWHLRGYITSMPSADGLLFNVGEVAALQARRAREAG